MTDTAREETPKLPTCDECGKSYIPKHASQRFCRKRCNDTWWNREKRRLADVGRQAERQAE